MSVGHSFQVSMVQLVRRSHDLSLTTSDMRVIGCAIITLRDAFLFTDGRYFLQASQQLDRYCSAHLILFFHLKDFLSNWKLMKQGLPGIVLRSSCSSFMTYLRGRRAHMAGISLQSQSFLSFWDHTLIEYYNSISSKERGLALILR
jgi:hypothetical protein